jgi:hypothetical protein
LKTKQAKTEHYEGEQSERKVNAMKANGSRKIEHKDLEQNQ